VQLPSDTDLAKAQSASIRRISGRLEFDWNRDGGYAHAYSDLSVLVTAATVDDAALNSQLPSEIQSTTGYSSGELRVTLSGKRRFTDLSAMQLFFPYNPSSPLAQLAIDGTPVRYSRWVRTASGRRELRQFTGYLRQPRINRKTGNVELVCSDISDVNSRLVTLPRWAVGQGFDLDTQNFTTAIDGTWVVEETLRQAGRPTGPATPPGCVAYCSMNGSTLPSVGNMLYTIAPNTHAVYSHNGDPWEVGKYGLTPRLQTNPIADARDVYYALFGTDRVVSVVNGSTSISISFWHKSDGTATTSNVSLPGSMPAGFSAVYLFLEQFAGAAILSIQKNGQAQFHMTTLGGTVWKSNYVAQTTGWHYYHLLVTFGASNVAWVFRIDGLLTNPSSVTNPFVTWSYTGGGPGYRTPLTNPVQIFVGGPTQHIAVRWSGAGSTAYTSGEQDPPTRDGRPLAYVERSALRLRWMPEVYRENCWEQLTKLSAAELGAVYTDVWGAIHYAPHASLNADISTAAISGTIILTEDQLQDFTIAPSLDTRRNSVSISTTDRHLINDIIWTQPDAEQFHILIGEVRYVRVQLENAVGVYSDPSINFRSAIKPLTPYNKYETVVSAILDNNAGQDATDPVNTAPTFDAQMKPDQRSMDLVMYGGSFSVAGSTGCYMGSYLGGQDVSMQISGTMYSDTSVLSETYSDPVSIIRSGLRVLRLGENEWVQVSETASTIAGSILVDTASPLPVVDGVSLRADPRMELRDVYKIRVEGVVIPDLIAQVIGIKRSDTLTDSTDSPVLRIAVQPGAALWDDPNSGWDVGSWSG
jgi:hypothetical protein